MPVLATAFPAETAGPSALKLILPSLSMCATGAAFMLRKASRREVCIFLTRVPRWTANESSPRVSCMTTNTPARPPWVQNLAHATRLLEASDDGRSEDLCAPTRTTGLGTSPSMNESAAAVYPMVSVPCGMMTPSAPLSISSATASASFCQCSTFMFSENIENRTLASMLAMSLISGTALTMSEVDRAGWTAPVL